MIVDPEKKIFDFFEELEKMEIKYYFFNYKEKLYLYNKNEVFLIEYEIVFSDKGYDDLYIRFSDNNLSLFDDYLRLKLTQEYSEINISDERFINKFEKKVEDIKKYSTNSVSLDLFLNGLIYIEYLQLIEAINEPYNKAYNSVVSNHKNDNGTSRLFRGFIIR